jgi:hypothetical protein
MSHDGSTVRTGVHEVIRQTKAILIRDEREPKPFFDNARDFRARISKIHKRSPLATGIADVRVSHDEIARPRGARPVHKLVSNALIRRAELQRRFRF